MSSDEDDIFKLVNKRKNLFSYNSSDDENSNLNMNSCLVSSKDSNDETERPKKLQKSRIKKNHSKPDDNVEIKNISKFVRKNKLREKFEKFKTFKEEKSHLISEANISEEESVQPQEYIQEVSPPHVTLSVCDPDESDDEENSINAIKKIIGSKSSLHVKSNPIKMSAKEAMENMQKIKSESNRMLREKEVSLPYHRPKALSLKDIMNRRRPAVSSDGKSLPIKMNDEQLKHYAMMLEERQKEIMVLCKSDSDDEDIEENIKPTETKVDDSSNNGKPDTEDIAEQSDLSFDQIINISNNNKKEIQDASTIQSEEESLTNQNIFGKGNEKDMNIDEIKNSSDMQEKYSDVNNANTENTTDLRTQHCDQIENNILVQTNKNSEKPIANVENQSKSFQYNSEIIDLVTECTKINKNCEDKVMNQTDVTNIDAFCDSELEYDDLDALIENAENIADVGAENNIINSKPKLTGAPGTVINLDGDDSMIKPTGVDLLKERFTYFANLQKEDDIKKDREKRYKPGTQHIKLKQQLEEEIAEQRSLEWTKRLEEEKLLKSEQKQILGDDSFEDIDKMEAKLDEMEENNIVDDGDDGDDEGDKDEDLIEDDVDMTDKPKKRNPMLEDEADESDDEHKTVVEENHPDCEEEENTADNCEEEENYETESGSDSEVELEQTERKKSRILRAFEDSDDENSTEIKTQNLLNEEKNSQDEELQLAQDNKTSDDLFPSQGPCDVVTLSKNIEGSRSEELGTFSILNTNPIEDKQDGPISVICETQNDNTNLDDIVGMCSGSFSQSFIIPNEKSQLTQSSEFGEDVMALCTGKFYDNEFVSQTDENILAQMEMLHTESVETPKILIPIENLDLDSVPSTISSLDIAKNNLNTDMNNSVKVNTEVHFINKKESKNTEETNKRDENLLKSILVELDDPEFDKPKQYKFFTDNENIKKKLVIDSDDEVGEESKEIKKKKKKLKQARALQISDDEEDDEMQMDCVEYESDDGDIEEKVYEYDSEENEVEVERPKKKRMGEFFENEAELSSEDEWAGSGDEDEAGLDTLEREAGDDDVFHEGKLQTELGQIHMREVMDQDKREVRLIQELLLEDADLGDGHRQRKFRWRNINGEMEAGATLDDCDTQEDEFESEEMWRKQRHEREMFLKKMQENAKENQNTSIDRKSIIKANLSSRTMSNLIAESKETPTEKPCIEKVPAKDIPSPKKPFAIFKQNYHGSILTRGRGALARLAALATPLVVDNDTPKVLASARGNFVFTARSHQDQKIRKRKAENSLSTPQLIKKMKTEEYKKTLFEQLRD